MKSKINLETPMNRLGLGGAFSNWFFDSKMMRQDQVISLKEFIALNPMMKVNKESFVCWRNDELKNKLRVGFIKESKSWQKLKNFLVENGLTYNDWVMLLPDIKTGKGNVPDYKLLNKKVLLQMPVCKVTEVKAGCSPIKDIARIIYGEMWDYNNPYQLRLMDVVKLTPSKIESNFTESAYNRTVRNTLLSIQSKMKEFGFTEKDGPFMKAFLAPTRTKDAYIADLVQNKKFSKDDAVVAVNFGLKAGWI